MAILSKKVKLKNDKSLFGEYLLNLKHIPQFCKYFCVFILIMHNLFCSINQSVWQKDITDWTFWVYLLTGRPSQFLIPADWIFENDLHQILCMVFEIFVKHSVWIVFLYLMYFPNCDLLKVSNHRQAGSILTRPS